MIALEVEYLSGRCYATDVSRRDRAEFPPHPARLFSAMVAAVHENGMGEDARQALKFLESLPPPSISAGRCAERDAVTVYVPPNDVASMPEIRKRQPRFFPSVTPEDSKVWFVWTEFKPEQRDGLKEHLEMIYTIAAHVTYLGSAASLVRISLCESPPEVTHVPDDEGDINFRIVSSGRLEELEQLYELSLSRNLNLRPTVERFQPYRLVSADITKDDCVESAFGEILVFRQRGVAKLPIEAALTLSDSVRNAVLRHAGDPAPDVLTGSNNHPHCAFVPLPFVGEPQQGSESPGRFVGGTYADGRLLGFAVLLPKSINDDERQTVLSALAKLKKVLLPGIGETEVEYLSNEDDVPKTLNLRTWSWPSRVWESVTPVIFDRYPKEDGHGLNAGQIVARSCAYVGLPSPKEISVGKFSSFIGVPPVMKFRTLRRKGDAVRFAAHIRVVFPVAVRGIVVLGAGRFFGLGLMRPIREFKTTEERDLQ